MELVIFDPLSMDRLKRSQPDVQRDLRDLNAAFFDLRQDLRREVQARGRSGDRAALARVDGLVTVAVGGRIVAGDVRRKRHVTELLDLGKKVGNGIEEERPLAEFAAGNDLGGESMAGFGLIATEKDALAERYFATWTNQSFPHQQVDI